MTKVLQKKFIITAMIAITALIIMLLGAINILNFVFTRNQLNETMAQVSEYEQNPERTFADTGPLPDPFSGIFSGAPKNEEDTVKSATYFVARFDTNGTLFSIDTDRTSSLDENSAKELAYQAVKSGKSSGNISVYQYSVMDSAVYSGETVIFLDTSVERASFFRVLLFSLGIGLLCWALMLGLVILLSRRAIKPIAENIERQRRFVTDAGHEIKTPLAIIQANTEAMELYNGENKWSGNIKNQVSRLSDLTKNLLTLARMDEGAKAVPCDFSLSELTQESFDSFQGSFELKGVHCNTQIEPGITVHADMQQIAQLLSVLFDNAVKYVNQGGSFELLLKRKERKAQLTVTNTVDELPSLEPEKLFERFARSDEARTQKNGGYGIGLSVAGAVVAANKGKIQASYGRCPFTVTFTVEFGAQNSSLIY